METFLSQRADGLWRRLDVPREGYELPPDWRRGLPLHCAAYVGGVLRDPAGPTEDEARRYLRWKDHVELRLTEQQLAHLKAARGQGFEDGGDGHEYAETLRRQRHLRRARRVLDAEERGELVIPEPVTLKELLDRPPDPVTYRIAGYWPSGGRLLLVAARKAGKTTLVGNVVRALADDRLFLGCCPVADKPGTIVVIDNEMNTSMLTSWYRDIGVENPDRVAVWTLRGQGRALDILDDDVRHDWATRLRSLPGGASALLLDCLAPALGALGLTESNEDVGAYLGAFDALLREADVSDALIAHHMGHIEDRALERGRGASRLRDWPEAEWRYVRERAEGGEEIERGARFLTAYGRDVDAEEARLEYDAATRRLTYEGGDRRRHGVERYIGVVERLVRETPGIATTALKEALGVAAGVRHAATLTQIVTRAEALGLVHHEPEGRTKRYHPGPSSPGGEVAT